MSNDEHFLARWSRLKREGAAEPAGADVPTAPASAPEQPTEDAGATAADDTTAIEPSALPPLESIDATTNVGLFLARGVPATLAREALRRAWLGDPRIRDFIGPSENAWDFTDPAGIPGFGPLETPAPAPALTEMRFPVDSSPHEAAAVPQSEPGTSVASSDAAAHELVKTDRSPAADRRGSEPVEEPSKIPETQESVAERNTSHASGYSVRRRHGSALPR